MLVMRERIDIEAGAPVGVTISIGVAGGIGKAVRFDTIVRDADAAMFSAKNLGRNQTYVFAEPEEDSRIPRAPVSAEGRESAIEIGRAARAAAEGLLHSVIRPLPHYRGKPSELIAEVATTMARNLDLPQAEIDRIRVASLLHDVGKVAIPSQIPPKPPPPPNTHPPPPGGGKGAPPQPDPRQARTAYQRRVAGRRPASPRRPAHPRACRLVED